MYAVIETGGKQYKVQEGDTIYIEKLEIEPESAFEFDKIILMSADNGVLVGTPYVEGAKVEGKVIKNGKKKKVVVYKYKPKKGYHKKQGHRQPYTKVEITKISV